MTRIGSGSAASTAPVSISGSPALRLVAVGADFMLSRCKSRERIVEGRNHRLGRGRILDAIDCGAKLRRAGQTLRVPADMLARHAAADRNTVMRQHRVVMLEHDVALLYWCGVGCPLAGGEEADHLADEPWPAIGAAPDHDAVGTGKRQRLRGIVERLDIAIGHDRDADCLLDAADEAPIGMAFVE